MVGWCVLSLESSWIFLGSCPYNSSLLLFPFLLIREHLRWWRPADEGCQAIQHRYHHAEEQPPPDVDGEEQSRGSAGPSACYLLATLEMEQLRPGCVLFQPLSLLYLPGVPHWLCVYHNSSIYVCVSTIPFWYCWGLQHSTAQTTALISALGQVFFVPWICMSMCQPSNKISSSCFWFQQYLLLVIAMPLTNMEDSTQNFETFCLLPVLSTLLVYFCGINWEWEYWINLWLNLIQNGRYHRLVWHRIFISLRVYYEHPRYVSIFIFLVMPLTAMSQGVSVIRLSASLDMRTPSNIRYLTMGNI